MLTPVGAAEEDTVSPTVGDPVMTFAQVCEAAVYPQLRGSRVFAFALAVGFAFAFAFWFCGYRVVTLCYYMCLGT